MYLDYYGLKKIPFGLTPNPEHIFITESYLEVVSNLKYCIQSGKGLVAVTGEVGTGKTMTMRSVLRQFARKIATSYIFNPSITVAELFEQLIGDLGVAVAASASKTEKLSALGQFLAQRHSVGLRTVLIIDEAHGLPRDILEEIRLLANFETNSEKLLQIILCGQPELREILNQPDLRQLKQRIALRCFIKPLGPFEVNRYIRFRLKSAGGERVNLFAPDAVALVGQVSLGVPRVINNICDNALLYGFASGRNIIARDLIEEVVDTLDMSCSDLLGKSESVAGSVIGSA